MKQEENIYHKFLEAIQQGRNFVEMAKDCVKLHNEAISNNAMTHEEIDKIIDKHLSFDDSTQQGKLLKIIIGKIVNEALQRQEITQSNEYKEIVNIINSK